MKESALNSVGVMPKCMAVLEVIAYSEHRMTFTDIMKASGIPKSSLHRIISILSQNNLIWMDKENKTYHLGMRIVSMGNYALKNMDLRKRAEKYLEDLRDLTSETARLAILDGLDMVYIDHKRSGQAVNISFRIGARGPVYCSSTGKAFVSFMPDVEKKELLEKIVFRKLTPNTIADLPQFIEEIEQTRRRGYAIEDEEQALGIRAIGAPIFGKDGPLAAISITVPAYRVSVDQLRDWSPSLISTAAQISLDIGGVA